MTRRLHDDVLVEAEVIAQREELFLGSVARRVLPFRRVGKLLARAEHVAMGVNGARRHSERGLRR
jgi:hypothetical protein